MNHPEHICRFNDAPQTCECYDAGYKEAEQERLEEVVDLIKTSKDPYMLPATEERFLKDLASLQNITK